MGTVPLPQLEPLPILLVFPFWCFSHRCLQSKIHHQINLLSTFTKNKALFFLISRMRHCLDVGVVERQETVDIFFSTHSKRQWTRLFFFFSFSNHKFSPQTQCRKTLTTSRNSKSIWLGKIPRFRTCTPSRLEFVDEPLKTNPVLSFINHSVTED